MQRRIADPVDRFASIAEEFCSWGTAADAGEEIDLAYVCQLLAELVAARDVKGGTRSKGTMIPTFDKILDLVSHRAVRVSDHGYDELAADGILVREVLTGVEKAQVLEEYPRLSEGSLRPRSPEG